VSLAADQTIDRVPTDTENQRWLERFHDGDRRVLEGCYRDHYATVAAAVGRHVRGADAETVVHDVFYTLLSSPRARRSFRGGSLGAWLTTMARNRAIDYIRQHSRLKSVDPAAAQALPSSDPDPATCAEARRLVEEVRRRLPEKWRAVFQARFVDQLSQREAAARIGCSRTTLAYREHRVRGVLRRYLLAPEAT
jgi:RNA polymerase sigma-70 factor (ECF subfamily)